MESRIVVLISGTGTNLQAIIDATAGDFAKRALPARIVRVISNRMGVQGLQRADAAGIPTTLLQWNRSEESREQYDQRLAAIVLKQLPDLVVLAGWMHLLTPSFLGHFDENQVLNLHPALPGQFPGTHAIERAFGSPGLRYSGVMVHTVVPEMDAGRVITMITVPRFHGDTLDNFTARIKSVEKTALVTAIGLHIAEQRNKLQMQLSEGDIILPAPQPPHSNNQTSDKLASPTILRLASASQQANALSHLPRKIREGKVRDIYDIGYGLLLMHATDRCSSFDRHICDIPGKGEVINRVSAWWFDQTRHIIGNHLLRSYHTHDYAVSIVRRCTVFPIEFVVRGYITGTTSTSMWTLYEKGVRTFGDTVLEEGACRNTALSEPVVTPTTKSDEHDEPINRAGIIERGLMTAEEYDYCHDIALRLFRFGQIVAAERGLILVDTKYEFGRLSDGSDEIVLADEVHTCDSSRYWKADTYDERMAAGKEPDRFDKDLIRVWVRQQCDPYTVEQIPEVPHDVIASVGAVYAEFQSILIPDRTTNPMPRAFPLNGIALSWLVGDYYHHHHAKRVVVVCEHISNQSAVVDRQTASFAQCARVELLTSKLKQSEIYVEVESHSLFEREKLVAMLQRQNKLPRVVYVIVAKFKHTRQMLQSLTSANTRHPVVSMKEVMDSGITAIYESIKRIL